MSAIRAAPLLLPVLPGVALAGRYFLGDPAGESHGDCLDAVAVPGGKVGMFVADVVGIDGPSDLAAEHVRAILRERLSSGVGLAEAMKTLDGYAETHSQLVAATACAAILDTVDGDLEWASAGHPPPLLWGPETPPAFLSGTPNQPLGTGGDLTIHSHRLGEGEMVAMYTDGLVAFEGRSLAQGSQLLSGAAARALAAGGSVVPGHLGDLICDRVLREMATTDTEGDDAAILLAIRTPRPDPLSLRVPAEPEQLPRLRHLINAWLDAQGVSLVDHVGLGHAVVELAANVIKHAYVDVDLEPDRQVILLDARLVDDGWVCITVSDHGRWREQGSSGRGLTMAAGLSDRMQVDRTAAGTRVQLAQRLSRPVPVMQPVREEPVEHLIDEELQELQLDVTPGHLTAKGPVDDLTVDLFHTALSRATNSGTRDARVDLDGISHLASPGVQALFEFVARSQRSGTRLTLHAGKDSATAQILRLVGLSVADTGP